MGKEKWITNNFLKNWLKQLLQEHGIPKTVKPSLQGTEERPMWLKNCPCPVLYTCAEKTKTHILKHERFSNYSTPMPFLKYYLDIRFEQMIYLGVPECLLLGIYYYINRTWGKGHVTNLRDTSKVSDNIQCWILI